jgi:hypothetical protein
MGAYDVTIIRMGAGGALCNMDSCLFVKPVLTATAHALGVGDPLLTRPA